jgi:heavy metal sensor kinase
MRVAFSSVRARLTLCHAGVLTLIVCIFSVAIVLFVKTRLYAALDAQLGQHLATIDRVFREEPGELKDLASDWGLTLFEVDQDGSAFHRTEAWERAGLSRALTDDRLTLAESWATADGRHYRMQKMSGPSYQVTAAIDEAPLRAALKALALVLAMLIPFATSLAVVGGYFLAGRVLRPVGAMADKARAISAESLGERLPINNPRDEFGRLATVVNEMLGRLDDSFERLRRFTTDASHELRTPLTAMRSVGEVALQGTLEPAAYRDVIGSMLEDVDRLTRLTDSLLTLTRAESGKITLMSEVSDVGELTRNVTDQLRVLAEEKQQSLSFEKVVSSSVVCDPGILRLGLMNLLHNAIRYTPAGGAIRVRVNARAGGQATIEVQDTGPGIPAAHQQKIFERFYRIDAGRSREVGGVGLGLAIARWAVEANGGYIELESEEEKGSLFRVVLPLAAEERAVA